MSRKITRRAAAALSLSLIIGTLAPISAQANVVDDAKDFIVGIGGKAGKFLDDIGVAGAVKSGYDTVNDFVFNYETQPDDDQMESLARTWAVTAWLADEDKEESNTYYFDNHTLTMTEDLTQIGSGYNLSKTPEGSYLNGRYTGVLKATVNDATNYTVEWVNYDDELNMYLAKLMQKKQAENAPETEAADALGTGAADVPET